MRVIELNSYFRWEIVQIFAARDKSLHDIVYRACNEEIFLKQSKLAAGCNRIRRIEDLGNGLGKHFLLDGLDVVAGVEDLHVEFVGGARWIEAHEVHGASAESRDWQVV